MSTISLTSALVGGGGDVHMLLHTVRIKINIQEKIMCQFGYLQGS